MIDFEIDAGTDTSYSKNPIKLEAQYNPNTLSPIWSDNINFLDTLSSSSTLTISNIGIYYIKVDDGNCIQIDSIEVISENIDISMFANDTCEGGSVFVGVQNLHPTIPINHYYWQDFLIDTSSIYDYPKESQWYAVEVINSEGCVLKDSIFVNVYENPILDNITITDSVVFLGESVTVMVVTNGFINWLDFEEKDNQIQDFPNTNFCYQVEVYNEYNCSLSD